MHIMGIPGVRVSSSFEIVVTQIVDMCSQANLLVEALNFLVSKRA